MINKVNQPFYKITGHKLTTTSLLNMFNILEDTDLDVKFLNIFRAYTITEGVRSNTTYYLTYEVDNSDFFDNISYKYYELPFMWWSITLMNEDISNPFEDIEPGQNIKILKSTYIPKLLREVKGISSL